MSNEESKETQVVKKKKKWMIPAIIGAVFAVAIIIVIAAIVVSTAPQRALKKQLDSGDKYLADLDYENAILAYEEALKIDPKSEAAYVRIADAYLMWSDDYYQAGDNDSAIEILQEGILVLNNGSQEIDLAEVIKKQGELEDKKSLVEKERDMKKAQEEAEKKQEEEEEVIPKENPKEKAIQALIKYVESPEAPFLLEDKWDNSNLGFMLAYIDNDDIPELVINGGKLSYILVCRCEDGSIEDKRSYSTNATKVTYYEKMGCVKYAALNGYAASPEGAIEGWSASFTLFDRPNNNYSEYWSYLLDGNHNRLREYDHKYYQEYTVIEKQEFMDGLGIDESCEKPITEGKFYTKQEIIEQLNAIER